MSGRFNKPSHIADIEHGVVHRDEAAFCGWPFVNGFWETAEGDFVVGFKTKPADYGDPNSINHDQVNFSGPKIKTIRSRDRGRTWDKDSVQILMDLGEDQEALFARNPPDYSASGPIDFSNPDTLVANGGTPDLFRPESTAWIKVSKDGGKSWLHPIRAEQHGLPSVTGSGSPLLRPDGVHLLFMTVVTDDGWKRRPAVFCAKEDGSNWAFMSYITNPQDDGAADNDRTMPIRFSGHRYFYARPILLPSGRILCSLRGQRDPTSVIWTEIFASDDGGRTWQFLSRVNDWGAPGDILRLADGRIACVYGYRMPGYGIRMRLSDDEGKTWGSETILRDDGGSWDLGYPRITEVSPGEILAVYYMNNRDDPIQQDGGVRYIAWSRFAI